MGRFHHLAHLQKTPLVKVGDWVKRGHQIGLVGSSGASTGAHLHYEIRKAKPASWRLYVKGLLIHQVRSLYEDPLPWIKQGIPCDNSLPLAGYGFLQFVRSASGNYYHPGRDLNGVNDLGKPIYSPVDGRVVCVEDVSPIKNWLGKITGYSDFNGGWGRHVWIEEAPNQPIP